MYLFAGKGCFLSPLPLSTVIGILNPTILAFIRGCVMCKKNGATSSCSNHLGSQVVIGYFLAAGRLTTGIGCNQCNLCANTFILTWYLWVHFETIHLIDLTKTFAMYLPWCVFASSNYTLPLTNVLSCQLPRHNWATSSWPVRTMYTHTVHPVQLYILYTLNTLYM